MNYNPEDTDNFEEGKTLNQSSSFNSSTKTLEAEEVWARPTDVKSKDNMMMSKLKALKSVRSIPKIPSDIFLPQQSDLSFSKNSIDIMMDNEASD